MDVQGRRRWVRFLSARGIPPGHIAFVLMISEDLVKRDLATRGQTTNSLTTHPPTPRRRLNPHDCHRRRILSNTGNKIRRLAELGYKPPAIASALMLDLMAIEDFLNRLTPIRRERVPTPMLARPRSVANDRAARHARAASEARKLTLLEQTPPAGWTYADRVKAAAVEAAEYARFLDVVRSGKLPAADLVDQARVFYTPPRRRPVDVPTVRPSVWTGETSFHLGAPKLTPEMIDEIRIMRAHRMSVGAIARRFGVTENTIYNALSGRTFQRS
jgi:hypothetical protein